MFAKFAGTPCISVGLAVWCPHFPSRSGPTWIWWFCPFWPPCRRRRSPDRRCCCCWAAAVGFCVSQLNAARFVISKLWSRPPLELEAAGGHFEELFVSLIISCHVMFNNTEIQSYDNTHASGYYTTILEEVHHTSTDMLLGWPTKTWIFLTLH
jgi:hypothetical protein